MKSANTENSEKNESTENADRRLLSELTEAIIGAAILVHRALGPGLLESAYCACLEYELQKQGFHVEREKPLPVTYDGLNVDYGYRLDLVVEGQVIVELKSVEALSALHDAQLLTYLKFSGCPVGLLFNFNTKVLKNGIRRIVR